MNDASKNAPRCFRKEGRTCLVAYKRVLVREWVGGRGYRPSARYHVWNPARVSPRSEWEHGLPPAEECVMLSAQAFFALTEEAPQAVFGAAPPQATERTPRRRRQRNRRRWPVAA